MPSRETTYRRGGREQYTEGGTPKYTRYRRTSPSRKLAYRHAEKRHHLVDTSETEDASSSSESKPLSGDKPPARVQELEGRTSSNSPGGSRTGQPYPSFSKAHSRETLAPGDANIKPSILTPDATDLGKEADDKRASTYVQVGQNAGDKAPPSPPLTATDPTLRTEGSRQSTIRTPDGSDAQTQAGQRDVGGPRTSVSSNNLRRVEQGSQASLGPRKSISPRTKKHRRYPSFPSTDTKSPATAREEDISDQRKGSLEALRSKSRSVTNHDVLNPVRRSPLARKPVSSAAAGIGKTPLTSSAPPRALNTTVSPANGSVAILGSETAAGNATDTSASGQTQFATAPPPPPPPPPPPMTVNPSEIPRVDYLLQNGGLDQLVPRSFVSVTSKVTQQSYQQYLSPQLNPGPRIGDDQNVFAPYLRLLDNYTSVITKNGSLAVATGYKSVARRLLERLEAVFARNISSELCTCAMCQNAYGGPASSDIDTGVSWGEALELVSGRKELPQWPPFSLASAPNGLNIADLDQPPPMQKLDIDVPEEYRAHYIRQSKKTKQAVQNWLANQPETQVAPPQEVDDETLTFAMLTYLAPEQRPVFTALLKGLSSIPSIRTSTPTPLSSTPAPRADLMTKTGNALQRLYSLPNPPRDPECSMFLLQNPPLHGALATLAAISSSEWDILVSGRFDGFLWSGAEEQLSTPAQRLNLNSRSSTPLGVGTSRSTTPLARTGIAATANPDVGGTSTPGPLDQWSTSQARPSPVQLDEETEIAVLAEVEREIYQGMEALEDAFEALHAKAEGVRRALRERGAGLALGAQARRGAEAEVPRIRGATPGQRFDHPPATNGGLASLAGLGIGADSETDDGLGAFDARSELAPDDSASNISGRRRRKRHGTSRRTERKTPAPVEEEDDE